MNQVEKYISDGNYDEALVSCLNNNLNYFGRLLDVIINDGKSQISTRFLANIEGLKKEGKIVSETIDTSKEENPPLIDEVPAEVPAEVARKNDQVRVKLLCNWTSSKNLRELWNKMSKGNYTWGKVTLVLDDDPDYFVVVNAPPKNINPDPSKTIIFRMEPHMGKNKGWGEWSRPDPDKFFKVCYHEDEYNNNEWHLSKTYTELKEMKIVKDDNLGSVLSTVLSDKYRDPGHIKRVDFVKYLDSKDFPVHVFGNNKWEYANYKGSLPPHEKDNAMFPYKYAFNVENHRIKNYYTEKLIDGIMAECLVFYSGCHNVRDYIDKKAFVYLELSNFEKDYEKIKKAIEENWWEKRLPYIRKAKAKILDHLQFFPRLERMVSEQI